MSINIWILQRFYVKIKSVMIMKLKGCGERISDIIDMPLPCGGNGKCGKCKIRIHGDISPIGADERKLLSEREIESGIRLACRCRVLGEAEADSVPHAKLHGITSGFSPEGRRINPITGNKKCTAAAFDIGTTTVAYYIYSLPEGVLAESGCFENAQRKFGADVISRISYAEAFGKEKLTEAIVSQINSIKENFKPEFSVVTGNTVMLHFYTGLDPSGIARFPFTPQSLFGSRFGGDYIPRCISPFIGADAYCAVIASEMTKTDEPSLLLDLGTNAEIALWDGKRLLCTSAAAGPCFEGYGLSRGMSAADGAISKAFVANGRICYETIGQKPPVGFCGSGITDAIAALLDLGEITENGLSENDIYIGNIPVTQDDIRQIQTAKAAVAAGIEILCGKSEAKPKKLYVAGGFGSSLNPKSAARIGLIPKELSENCIQLGNAAAAGAQMMLLDKKLMKNPDFTAETVELSGNREFSESFIKHMGF